MTLNNGCIQYIPSSTFGNGSTDNFSLEACNFDGPCSTIEYFINIDTYCNSPLSGPTLNSIEVIGEVSRIEHENANRTDEWIETENPIVAYPNPNNGQFTLQLPKDYDPKQVIQVFNANGQRLEQYIIPFGDETNSIDVNLTDHPQGIYLIRWEGPYEAYNLKVVVN